MKTPDSLLLLSSSALAFHAAVLLLILLLNPAINITLYFFREVNGNIIYAWINLPALQKLSKTKFSTVKIILLVFPIMRDVTVNHPWSSAQLFKLLCFTITWVSCTGFKPSFIVYSLLFLIKIIWKKPLKDVASDETSESRCWWNWRFQTERWWENRNWSERHSDKHLMRLKSWS